MNGAGLFTGRPAQWTGIALLALGALAIPMAARVSIDNRLERWVDATGAPAQRYARFKALFESDEFILAAYTGKDLFDTASLEEQIDALERLEALPHVTRVSGIPAVFRDQFGGEDAAALRDEFHSTPFYKGALISNDGAVGGLLIETAPPDTPAGRHEFMAGIHTAIAPLQSAGWEIHIVGPPQLNVVLDDLSSRESLRVFPLAVACAVAVLALLFRSARATLIAVACAGLSLLLTLALMGLSGRSMTMVTSSMPSLLWVLVLSNIIHLLRRYQHHRVDRPAEEALRCALRETARPCTLAAVTTAFGFGSLIVANMVPVRELGFFSAAGLLISLSVNLTVGPLLIRWFRLPAPRNKRVAAPYWPAPVIHFTRRHAGSILAISTLALAVTLASVFWLRVESDPLVFLPADSPVREDYAFVSERLSGFYTLELVIDAPGGWLQPPVWNALDEVTHAIESMPGVARVMSPVDFLRKLNQWDHAFAPEAYAPPKDAAAAHALLAELDDAGSAPLRRLVSESGEVVRLSALVRVMGSSEFHQIVAAAEDALDKLPPPLHGEATGIVLQLVNAQLNLVYTQIESLGLAFVIIFGCIGIGLRSWRLTLVSIAPNLLPILSALTVMATAGILLDAATVMMASIALGIAVDDTIHMLSAYRERRRAGTAGADMVEHAYLQVAPSMLMTTVVACIGFFALCRSAFVPIQYFGGLSGIAMLVALAADLLLVPATLFRFGKWL